MKTAYTKTIRAESDFRDYAQANPELTAIKLAETFSRKNGLECFRRRTAGLVCCAAAVFLTAVLILLSGIGLQTVTHSTANRTAFRSSINELVSSHSIIDEIQLLSDDSYCVYVDGDDWDSRSASWQTAFYASLSQSINDACRAYHILGRGSTAQLYLYDLDGLLLMQP